VRIILALLAALLFPAPTLACQMCVANPGGGGHCISVPYAMMNCVMFFPAGGGATSCVSGGGCDGIPKFWRLRPTSSRERLVRAYLFGDRNDAVRQMRAAGYGAVLYNGTPIYDDTGKYGTTRASGDTWGRVKLIYR